MKACQMIEVNPSTFYYNTKVPREHRETKDADIRDYIEQIHLTHPNAGYRMLKQYLWFDYGINVNGKKIRRIQKEYNLQAEIKRAFIHTTDSNHQYEVYENLIKGFCPIVPNVVWVADITYIRIATGFLYLAVVMDLASRKVLGWELSRKIDEKLTCSALEMVIKERGSAKGIIHHSDRGVQYCSLRYRGLMAQHGMLVSCSRKGNPYDNASMERFMRTLKQDEVYLRHYETIEDVLETLPNFLEEVYNKKRRHSSLGYLTPEEFETNKKALMLNSCHPIQLN